MTIKQRLACIAEVSEYTNIDAYVSDLALSPIWGDAPEDDILQERIEELRTLYTRCTMSVKEIAASAGLSSRKLAERFAIPYRTVENWCSGTNSCPTYIRLMMIEILSK